jgi:predicted dehydrogenase
MKSGELLVQDVPAPVCRPGGLLVSTAFSLISPGTERATVETAQQSLAGKARSRPDLVRQVIDSAQREGIATTVRKVRDRLDTVKPMGYSSAGTVLEVGEGCSADVGRMVACGGGGYAAHAEVVWVPKHLCAQVPDGVVAEKAAFTTIGAIALQGVRQCQVAIGETVVVIGLGLVGQLCIQILKAAGCKVIGVDVDEERCRLARDVADEVCGPDAAEDRVMQTTSSTGVDAVLISASTRDNGPIQLAPKLCRDRGRVIVLGAVGLELEREPFYSRDIELRMSRSYGPGRYDPSYEEEGHDYPIGHVRWTEQRNMAAFLELLRSGKVDVAPLITHQFPINRAGEAYDLIQADRSALGVLLEYPESTNKVVRRIEIRQTGDGKSTDSVQVGFIGAGNFAQTHLLPHLKRQSDVMLSCVTTQTGGNARKVAEKHGFQSCSSDADEVIEDAELNTVFIATRHNTHAQLAASCLRSNKHVFVEKPLALTADQLAEVEGAYVESGKILQVGFNRRFAPLTEWAAAELSKQTGPITLLYRVNAGPIPADHWILDREVGGGRILGEVCHFVDYAQHLLGSRFSSVYAQSLRGGDDRLARDNVLAHLEAENGGAATIAYVATGDRGMEKERIEIFRGGLSIVIEDFQRGWSFVNGRKQKAPVKAGKGHREEVEAFLSAVRSGKGEPVPVAEALHATRVTFAIETSLNTGSPADPDRPVSE